MSQQSEVATSPAEVAQALRDLSDADLIRLEDYGRFRTYGMPWFSAKDLLHEAIARALGGDRRWPRHVPFAIFLRETMRSIAHEEMRHRVDGPIVSQAELGECSNPDEPGLLDNLPDRQPGPEREVAARQALQAIHDAFADDMVALAVLAGLAEGQQPDEVCRKVNISRTEYQTAQKRIRRRLARQAGTVGTQQ